jgi:hypothetical protein
MADDNLLSIKIMVDSSQLSSGMSQAVSVVTSASEEMAKATLLNASAQNTLRDAIRKYVAGDLPNLAVATKMVSQAQEEAALRALVLQRATAALAPAFEHAAVAEVASAAALTGLDRAMAAGTGRMAGFLGGAGAVGGALGRIGAASSSLGPLLAAAFPVFAAVALVDVLSVGIEKFNKWRDLGEEIVHRVDDLTISVVKQGDALALEDVKLGNMLAKFQGLPENHLAEMLIESKIKAEEFGKAIADDLQKLQQLLSSGPGFFSEAILGKANVSAIGDMLKPLEREYQLALLGNDQTAQKNVLLKEQALLQKALTDEQAKHTTVVPSGPRGMVDKTVGRGPDADAMNAYGEALKAVSSQLAQLNTLQDVQGKLTKVGSEEDKKAAQDKINRRAEDLANDAAYSAKLVEEDQKKFDKQQEQAEEFDAKMDRLSRETAEKDLREFEQGVKARQRVYDEDLRITEEVARAKERTIAALADFELASGKISVAGAAQMKLQALQIEHDAEKAAIQKRNTLLNSEDPDSPEKRKQLYAKLLILDEQYQAARLGVETKSTNASMKMWDSAFMQLNRTFASAIQGMVTGTQSFGSAFGRMLDDITAKFLSAMARQATAWAVNLAVGKALHKSAQQEQVLADAKGAAAGAFRSVMDSLPFPLNAVLAPPAAAAAFVAVEAFSAARGMLVPGNIPGSGVLTMVHANETILPASISTGMQSAINRGGFGGGSSADAGTHLHYSVTVNAIDARGMKEALAGHGDTIAALLQQRAREFRS